jgi:hypothetical protein
MTVPCCSVSRHRVRTTAFMLLVAAAGIAGQPTAVADTTPAPSAEQRLEQRVEDLATELQAVKAELARMKQERAAAVPVVPNATATPVAPGSGPAAPSATEKPASPADRLSLWGYGEVYLTRPTHRPEDTQADLARAVFGIGYSFDERTNFNSEFEVEHAVSSASDVGEFEVEQFFVDHQLNDWATLRGGLFLMPFGLLNEHHEPTNFYGVQRNFVETLIIPSTWREGGIELNTRSQSGLSVSVGLTTGFDLSKWNYTPEFPPYHTALQLEDNDVAPLQATHQELALANAQHPSAHLAVNYTGLPGLRVGAAIFAGDAVKVPAPPNAVIAGEQRVTLWETHARWTPAGLDLSAVYARGAISNTATANAANPGSPNPIPSAFDGYFVQAAYADGWTLERYRLSPFVRFEHYDLGTSYAGVSGPAIPAGLVPLSASPGDYGRWPVGMDRVWSVGANLYVTPNVVVKFDYQSFDVNRDFSRVDLGLGLSF